MLVKARKLYVVILAFVCAAALCLSAVLFVSPVSAEEGTTKLSDFGGDLAAAANGWIETEDDWDGNSESNYFGNYDFALNGDVLDLSFDLKLTKSYGQLWLVLKTKEDVEDITGLRIILFTGASGGTNLGATVQTGTGVSLIGNQLQAIAAEGDIYTVAISVKWENEYSKFTMSISFTNQETNEVFKALDNFSYDFTLTDADPDFGATVKDNDVVRFFAAGNTSVGIKDVEAVQEPAIETKNLSELGGDFAAAANGWIVTKPADNYYGTYDFAANDNRIDLSFDLTLTEAKGQIWLIFKTGDSGNQQGLRFLIHSGATNGNLIGGVIWSNVPEAALSEQKTFPTQSGKTYTVYVGLEWGADYNSFTASLYFTDQETNELFKAVDNFSYDFAQTSVDPDFGATVKDNDTVRMFVSDATVTLGLKDTGVEATDPEEPDEPVIEPDEAYAETSTEKPADMSNVNVMNIEDFMETVSIYTMTTGATVTDDGNFLLDATMFDDRNPNISFKNKENNGKYAGDYAIKFRTVNDTQDPATAESMLDPTFNVEQKKETNIDIFIELGATTQSSYVSPTGSYVIRFFWDMAGGSRLVQFYPNGLQSSSMKSVDLKTLAGYDADFLPMGKEFTIEAGRFSTQTQDGKELLTLYIEVSNEEGDVFYLQCTFGGSNIYSHAETGGYVRIASASYVRTASVRILPIDESTNVTAKYVPDYVEAATVVDHDISDYLPIGQDGKTYTSTSDTEVLDIINCRKFINNTKNDMYLSFTGDYTLTLAFFTDRYEDNNCSAGYQVVFTPDEITIQSYAGAVTASKSKAYSMPEGTKFKVTVRLVQLFVDGLTSGERLTLYIDDELILEENFGLQGTGTLPTYFDGTLTGNGSVTIYPYSTTVTASSGLVLDLDDDSVDVGKQIRLQATNTKEIIGETISFKIVEGADVAEIVYNEESDRYYLKGVADGVVKVAAVVTNEFGTFESEAASVTVGTGESQQQQQQGGEETTGGGCNSAIAVSSVLVSAIVLGAVVVMAVRKKKTER